MNLELRCKISRLNTELLRNLSMLEKCSSGTLARQFFRVKGFSLFLPVKTCLIMDRGCIFSRCLVSKVPPAEGDAQAPSMAGQPSTNKRSHQMSSVRSYQKLPKCKDALFLKPFTKEAKHYGKQLRLVDMMDNSPLRFELTTYPQPLLPVFINSRKKEKEDA